jgi:hypothetical protein
MPKRALFFIAMLLAIMNYSAGYACQNLTYFNCPGSPTGRCFFKVFYKAGGSSIYTIPVGRSTPFAHFHPGDTYCVNINGPPGDECNDVPIPNCY